IVYVFDLAAAVAPGTPGLSVQVGHRERKRDGEWSKPKFQRINYDQIPALPDPADRQVLSLLVGAQQRSQWSGYGYYGSTDVQYTFSEPMQEAILPLMCRTGRCYLMTAGDSANLRPLAWDEGAPWEFAIQVSASEPGKEYAVTGQF